MDWRSWKVRRIFLGNNGCESQAIYEAEDKGFRARLIFALPQGLRLNRGNAEELVSTFLIVLGMDSRGCFDALTSTEVPGISMEIVDH